MPKSAPVLFAGVCVAGAASLLYFAQLAAVQSAPAYSTFNTHPDGAKLLFDGLREAGTVKVSRQLKSVSLQKPKDSAVFFLGIVPFELEVASPQYFDELENAASAGNRLIIAVANNAYAYPEAKALRWGLYFVPNSISVDKSWRALPEFGPDVWQRNFGKGNVILVAHAQRLTNKGVATTEANRELLRRLLGDYPAVVFEEAHLGITETGSIAGLARHYHLEGLVAGLLLVAILFIWSRSVSFPPAPAIPENPMAGSDTRTMLTELMSRHLKGRLMAACVAEWNRTRGHAAAIQAPEESDPVSAYAKVQENL
jgi:hypothetical protein